MWDLIVSVLDHCLSFYFVLISNNHCPMSKVNDDRLMALQQYFSHKTLSVACHGILRIAMVHRGILCYGIPWPLMKVWNHVE